MKTVFYSLAVFFTLVSCQNNSKESSAQQSETVGTEQSATSQPVTFVAADGLEITADYYANENASKFIILCHQDGSSRGEYLTIAPRLVQAGYACLAIDQRVGHESREVPNETYVRASTAGLNPTYQDVRTDIVSAIDYVQSITDKKIVLWGSSYSATLALMIGRDDKRVDRVVAFSPGIYFGSEDHLIRSIEDYTKPVFVTCAKSEHENTFRFVAHVGDKFLKYEIPEFEGVHGSSHLWAQNRSTDRIFTSLLNFLK